MWIIKTFGIETELLVKYFSYMKLYFLIRCKVKIYFALIFLENPPLFPLCWSEFTFIQRNVKFHILQYLRIEVRRLHKLNSLIKLHHAFNDTSLVHRKIANIILELLSFEFLLQVDDKNFRKVLIKHWLVIFDWIKCSCIYANVLVEMRKSYPQLFNFIAKG